jgi:hypothetical protein
LNFHARAGTNYKWLNGFNNIGHNPESTLTCDLFIRDVLPQNEVPKLQQGDIFVIGIISLRS